MGAHFLFNFSDHLLADDFGFVVFSAGSLGDLMVVVADEVGRYVAPTVHHSAVEMTDWADYSNAEGECARGHRWSTNDTVHLHAWDSADVNTYSVTDLVRVPFDDRSRAYVECPACGKSIRFVCGF
ncbi:hypothetical protein [Saccharopolyspora sp. SCSIO 74807]|uniref:hypothetical protein n=1 Tax=Saccharopolyspora sp. SCSIO 74807 TaxID=3118084 RepID=UPI0030CC381E